MVYEQLVGEEPVMDITKILGPSLRSRRQQHGAQLLLTCSDIYFEFLPVLYGRLGVQAIGLSQLQQGLAVVGPYPCSFIKRIELQYTDTPIIMMRDKKGEVKPDNELLYHLRYLSCPCLHSSW